MGEERIRSWSQGMEELFQALADRTRLRILKILYAEGEVCVGDLVQVIGTNQPKISRHLAYLRRRRLVAFSRQGLIVRYRLAWPADQEQEDLVLGLLKRGVSSFETAEDLRRLASVRADLPLEQEDSSIVREVENRWEDQNQPSQAAQEDIQIELL